MRRTLTTAATLAFLTAGVYVSPASAKLITAAAGNTLGLLPGPSSVGLVDAPRAAQTVPELRQMALKALRSRSEASTPEPQRIVAAEYAAARETGCPYTWGGAGPCHWGGFDCSGLVMRAYQAAGVQLPHNVAAMVMTSGRLRWIPESQARQGDLAVYGTGWAAYHIALVWYAHLGHVRWLFAASTWGQLSGPYRAEWFPPTAYYRVR